MRPIDLAGASSYPRLPSGVQEGGWSIVCGIPGNDHNSEVITTDASQCGFCDYNYLLLLLRVFMAFYFSGFFPSSIYRTMTYD